MGRFSIFRKNKNSAAPSGPSTEAMLDKSDDVRNGSSTMRTMNPNDVFHNIPEENYKLEMELANKQFEQFQQMFDLQTIQEIKMWDGQDVDELKRLVSKIPEGDKKNTIQTKATKFIQIMQEVKSLTDKVSREMNKRPKSEEEENLIELKSKHEERLHDILKPGTDLTETIRQLKELQSLQNTVSEGLAFSLKGEVAQNDGTPESTNVTSQAQRLKTIKSNLSRSIKNYNTLYEDLAIETFLQKIYDLKQVSDLEQIVNDQKRCNPYGCSDTVLEFNNPGVESPPVNQLREKNVVSANAETEQLEAKETIRTPTTTQETPQTLNLGVRSPRAIEAEKKKMARRERLMRSRRQGNTRRLAEFETHEDSALVFGLLFMVFLIVFYFLARRFSGYARQPATPKLRGIKKNVPMYRDNDEL